MRKQILGLTNNLKYYYCKHPVNMCKGIDSLKGIIMNEFKMNPEDGSVFVFISSNHRMIKLLHYERNAFTLYTRKIYCARFVYPIYNPETDVYELDWKRLCRLIEGYRYTRHSST